MTHTGFFYTILVVISIIVLSDSSFGFEFNNQFQRFQFQQPPRDFNFNLGQMRQYYVQKKQHPVCGATTVRLNMIMNKLYGKWYPIEVSNEAYQLWTSSLFGNQRNPTNNNALICPIWEFKRNLNQVSDLQIPTMKVKISAEQAKVDIEAILLGDEKHPGKSKWLMSWPTNEDTLTSIVAVGTNVNSTANKYDWLLTMDCDINEDESPDWAIFSRSPELDLNVLNALKAVVEGIPGVDTLNTKVLGYTCKM